MPVLLGMSSSVKGRKFDVNEEEVTVGRNTGNRIVLDDPSISGQHCAILKNGNRYTLRDLDSTNGSRVNGEAIQECGLCAKDILQFGNVEFMFDGADIEAEPEADGAPAPAAPGEGAPAENTSPEGASAEGDAPQAVAPPAETNQVPSNFKTASPFGTRHRHHERIWFIVIGAISLLVLGVMVYFLLTAF